MSKRTGPHRVKLSDFKDKKEREGAIIIDTDDGEFTIPPAELWPDEVQDLAQKRDVVGMAKAILGDAEYERFHAAGGTAAMLNAIYAEAQGVDPGE